MESWRCKIFGLNWSSEGRADKGQTNLTKDSAKIEQVDGLLLKVGFLKSMMENETIQFKTSYSI